MAMNEIRTISLFSGCGGLDIGFKEAGFRILFATDIWDVACETLRKNNAADTVYQADIRSLDFKKLAEEYGPIDCLIGGPPCPPYSQTRHYLTEKKDGFEDEKTGFAVPEYFRALQELKPKVFVFENVDGFLFKTHAEAFAYLKKQSETLGYGICYRILNCADYGVPQTRKRFLCVGVRDGRTFSFPESTHAKIPTAGKKKWVTCGEAISDFDGVTEEESRQRPGGKDYELFARIPAGDNYLFYTEKRGCADPKFKWKSRYWTFLLKLSPDRPSWTIQASFSQNQGPFHWKNRFLRIEELKRLQTIPDSYQLCGNFKEQWRQVGNAVPSLFANVLAKKIKEEIFCGERGEV